MRNNAWIALAIAGIIIAFTLRSSTVVIGSIDVQENGAAVVNNTATLNVESPLNVTNDSGIAVINLPLADDNVFVGNSSGVPVATAWPDCDLNFQATTYSTGSNAIGCQFIPNGYLVADGTAPWTTPGWSCGNTSDTGFGAHQNNLFYNLIVPSETITYTSIGLNVTSAGGVGTVARLGIYEANESANGVTPGALVVDAGTVAINSTGQKTIAISETLERGKPYFTVFVHDAAALGVSRCLEAQTYITPIIGRGGNAGANMRSALLQVTGAGVGALPDPATTPDTSIVIQVASVIRLSE